MQKIQRIPLEQRLQNAAIIASGCPAACWLCLETYCRTLSEMSDDTGYMERYYCYAMMDGCYGDIEDSFVAQTAAEALSAGFSSETAELLYAILVQPFTDKHIWRDRR